MISVYTRHLLLRSLRFTAVAYLVSAVAMITSTFIDATTDKNHALAADLGLAIGVAHVASAPWIGLFAAIGGATLYRAQALLCREDRILLASGLPWRLLVLPGLIPALILSLVSCLLLFVAVPRAESTIRELRWIDADQVRDALLFQGAAQSGTFSLLEGQPGPTDRSIGQLRIAVGEAPALPFLLWADRADVMSVKDGVISLDLKSGGAAGKALAPALAQQALSFEVGSLRVPMSVMFKRHEGQNWSRPEFRRADRLGDDARLAAMHPTEGARAAGYRFELWRRIAFGLAPMLAALQIHLSFGLGTRSPRDLFRNLLRSLFVLAVWVLCLSSAVSFSRATYELALLVLILPILLGCAPALMRRRAGS